MDHLFNTKQAAAVLNMSTTYIKSLKRRGKLVPANEATRKHITDPMFFHAEDIYRIADYIEEHPVGQAFESHMNRLGDRSDASRLPLMPKTNPTETPERYFTTREVAEMLQIYTGSVARLAMRGELPCFQKHPGVRGSPLYFRSRDVQALYANEEYQRKRKSLVDGLNRIRLPQPVFEPRWKVSLAPDEGNDGRKSIHTSHGDYFSVRQAAEWLNITVRTVRQLIHTGRLKGVHVKKIRRHKYTCYQQWRILKSDVIELGLNEDYMKRSRMAKKNARHRIPGNSFTSTVTATSNSSKHGWSNLDLDYQNQQIIETQNEQPVRSRYR
ncbi:MAG: helix-turn-helix domain-containing protein [Chthonomonadales bacterium]